MPDVTTEVRLGQIRERAERLRTEEAKALARRDAVTQRLEETKRALRDEFGAESLQDATTLLRDTEKKLKTLMDEAEEALGETT
jgi:hypothetical protein